MAGPLGPTANGSVDQVKVLLRNATVPDGESKSGAEEDQGIIH